MVEASKGISLHELTITTAQTVEQQTGRPLTHPQHPFDRSKSPVQFLGNTFGKALKAVKEQDEQWQTIPHPGTKTTLFTNEQVGRVLEELRQMANGEDRSSWNIRKTLGDPDLVIDAVKDQLLPKPDA